MTISDFTDEARELDRRAGDGIDVRLLWHPTTGTVSVSVFDTTHEEAFEFVVDPANALDAFHHPFAYRDDRVTSGQTRTARSGA